MKKSRKNKNNRVPKIDFIMSRIYFEKTKAFTLLFMCAFVGLSLNLQAQIACNNSVQVSLEGNCEINIGADMILEGDYPDYSAFNVAVEGFTDALVTSPGSYTVTITDGSDNSCWGQIEVEDKFAPILDLPEINTDCSQSVAPGSSISSKVLLGGAVTGGGVTTSTDGVYVINFPTTTGAIISDVNFHLHVTTDVVSDFSATLTAPNGTEISLFSGPGTLLTPDCDGNNLALSLNDEALLSHGDLQWDCFAEYPSARGEYQPQNSLSAFDGMDPSGGWILEVATTGTQGTLRSAFLEVVMSVGTVSYPLQGVFALVGENEYDIADGGLCGANHCTYEDIVEVMPCTSDYAEIITRRWRVSDPSGNVTTGDQVINVRRKTIDQICNPALINDPNGPMAAEFAAHFPGSLTEGFLKWPHNYDDLDRRVIFCDELGVISVDDNGHPAPAYTGSPSDWSSADGSFCANIQMSYEDLRIDICANSFKLLREWKILDWCTGTIKRHDQIIKVLDRPLIVTCPPEQSIGTDVYDCGARYAVPAPSVLNDSLGCSTLEFTYTVSYKPRTASGEPFDNPITEGVTGSSESGYFIESVLPDSTWIIYTITDECGRVEQCFNEVEVIDGIPPVPVCDEFTVVGVGNNGMAIIKAESFDDGSWDNCEISHFEAAKAVDACSGQPGQFLDELRFCCSEIGDTIMVTMRVYDANGNYNSCEVEVAVQDKLPPFIYCPDDVTLACHEDFRNLELTGGAPEFIDNCSATIESSYNGDVDQCGAGVISLVWTATDIGGLTASCVQNITLVDNDPFAMTATHWPIDVDIRDECGADTGPDRTGYPTTSHDDNCSLVAVDYEDIQFNFVDGACLKILREWTVIDWCQYTENDANSSGIWHHTQVIKLHNSVAPTITGDCQDKTFCGYGPECSGEVTLIQKGIDDCTAVEDIEWVYRIDAFDDGTTDAAGNSKDASGNYPFGTHRIYWEAEDKCGNVSYCDFQFTVEDCKAPTPYCLRTVNSAVMPINGTLEIWANDFDIGSFDNCTASEDLIFSFSADITNTSRTFTCADISDGISENIALEMWVTDENGAQDFCNVEINIQDNAGDVCVNGSGSGALITGYVQTEESRMIENAKVQIMSQSPEYPKADFTSNGQYSFNNLLMGNTYDLTTEGDNDVNNGVSTLDLVLIQKHILGLQLLSSPYKIIAADGDNSGHLSASDLVTIRKIILGIDTQFPNGQASWRFVDGNFTFANPSNPFPYDESVTVTNLNQTMINMNFMAVKIGDVNATAVVNNAAITEGRTNKTLSFLANEMNFEKNSNVIVDVTADNFEDLVGFQQTMTIEDNNLTFVGFEGRGIDTESSEFGFHIDRDNNITMNWYSVTGKTFSSDEVLFQIIFRANGSGKLSQALSVNSDITSKEAYTSTLELMNTELAFTDAQGNISKEFRLYQNTPNPFGNKTTIGFDLPSSQEVTFKIMDVAGKIVFESNKRYAEGYNEIQVNKEMLKVSGLLYYTLESGQFTATKKMIGLK